MFNSNIYAKRRQALIKQLGARDVAIIATSPEALRNPECEYPYRHDGNFYYLTGFKEPHAWLILSGQGHCVLFCQPKDPEREIWDGLRLGVQDAPEVLAIDAAYSVEQLDELMPKMLIDVDTVWYQYADMFGVAKSINNWIAQVKRRVRAGMLAPVKQNDLSVLLDEMRLIKDEHELDLISKACKISAEAHILAMKKSVAMLRAGKEVREYHLEAELLQHFRDCGAQFPAYGSIVGAGANACILHYRADDALIKAGELVLIDAGCEFNSYASDITRTFPANGKFTEPQKTIYQLVLEAQTAAIELIKPGIRYHELHDCASKVISQGLLDLGLLDKNKVGTLDDVLENKSYNQFYMHGTGHWMGMDVHDVGSYMQPGEQDNMMPNILLPNKITNARKLNRIVQPNMVFTIEPGIYISPAKDVAQEYWNIGVRIEDDVVVTANGSRLLTREVPVQIDEIEAIMHC